MIEPLYTLDVACELIPITHDALTHILSRRASEFGPPLYRDGGEPRYHNGVLLDYNGGQPLRMLRESDCLKVRDMIIRVGWLRTVPKPAYESSGRPPSNYGRGNYRKAVDLLVADESELENVG